MRTGGHRDLVSLPRRVRQLGQTRRVELRGLPRHRVTATCRHLLPHLAGEQRAHDRDALAAAAPLFRFMQENQATMRDLSVGETFKSRMLRLLELLKQPEGTMTDRVRCFTAIFAMHAGMFALRDVEGDPEEKQEAILEVATDLIVRAQGVTE
ncbi:hypothetical protein OG292_15905 [Streptomyces sp. NBC_01511]|uniref:hypothetical protein n=1 Tax=Streptomyces sp. NBC_01511 TaxID=2903889 RepID=UPI00386A1BF2